MCICMSGVGGSQDCTSGKILSTELLENPTGLGILYSLFKNFNAFYQLMHYMCITINM